MDVLINIVFGGLFYCLVAMVQMAPISLPIILLFFAHQTWREYLLQSFLAGVKWVTLEIRLPREIMKSPAAMEVVLNAFNQPGAGNKYNQKFKGFVRLWSSLELVCIGGKLRFLVHIPANFRNQVEAQFYAQYPGVEITETEDYTAAINYLEPDTDWEVFGVEFRKARKETYIPIKTYYDFGIGPDKNVKEEVKTDPITATLEALGSVPPDHQMWLQILIMSPKADDTGAPLWKKDADEYLKKLYEPGEKFKTVSPPDREVAEAVTRAVSKPAFDVGIRGMYVAKKDKFNMGIGGAIGGALKQYGSVHLNSFKPVASAASEPTLLRERYQELYGTKTKRLKQLFFDAYRNRGYFYDPHDRPTYTMNYEELATIWHLPGSVAATPALDRLESKAAEPPANLPV